MEWLNEQVREMAELFPGFAVADKDDEYIRWMGTLQPRDESPRSTVEITAYAAETQDPIVHVLSPIPGQDAPHRYADGRLCLYYPPDGTWSEARSVARTIVPLVALWLYCYELWQRTGKWYAPEAPHGLHNAEIAK